MAKPRTNYTRDFNMSILPQIESGLSIVQVARKNGLHPRLVGIWKREYLDNPEKAFAGPGHPYKDPHCQV
jgi:transposase-like protein